MQKVDLEGLLNDAIQQTGLPTKEGIRIRTELHSRPQIIVDPERMRSVFENLLLNAVEAIEVDDGEIDISSSRKQDNLILEFRDNGVGIPQDFLTHRLFKPFQTTKPRGLGIGLYQCKATIEAHGGTIEALGRDGGGTILQIHLPLS